MLEVVPGVAIDLDIDGVASSIGISQGTAVNVTLGEGQDG